MEATMKVFSALALVAFVFLTPVLAEDATAPALGSGTEAVAPERAWQDVITGQIEAFRLHDGAAALSFASTFFQQNYSDPEQFYSDILTMGYQAIVQSRSHSFGAFQQLGPDAVMQIVKIIGPDQHLYEAVYQLAHEPDGWRVAGVQLTQEQGIGI
jgi:Domain of unknown function (DUF4864)